MLKTAICAALLSITALAQAAPVVYFGANQSPGNAVSGAPATARNSFLSNLSGVGSEGFEGFADDTGAPLNLIFTGSSGSLAAQLTGQGAIDDINGAGRFNTTPAGGHFYAVSGAFVITFQTAVSAFGFYGTDIGDFEGELTIELTDAANNVTALALPSTLNSNNGALHFFGFIDATTSYTRISFGNTQSRNDIFGFDDMVIGDRQQVVIPVSAPGTLALVGLGLVGLGLSRRKA